LLVIQVGEKREHKKSKKKKMGYDGGAHELSRSDSQK